MRKMTRSNKNNEIVSFKSCKRINELVQNCLTMDAEDAKEARVLRYIASDIFNVTLHHSKPDNLVFFRGSPGTIYQAYFTFCS